MFLSNKRTKIYNLELQSCYDGNYMIYQWKTDGKIQHASETRILRFGYYGL